MAGGASQWFSFLAEEAGELHLDTEGSSFDTILAVYTNAGASFSTLFSLACDNNSGLDHLDSALSLRTRPGSVYLIAVDGVNAASGVLRLNYNLVTSSRLTSLGFDDLGRYRLRVTGRREMRFLLQSSSNLQAWSDLSNILSPTLTYDFLDPDRSLSAPRFYRVLMLP